MTLNAFSMEELGIAEMKDHIAMLNNSISQSIDVYLKNGNIRELQNLNY